MPRNKLNLHLLSSNREGNRHRLFFLIFTILFGIGLFLFFQSKFTVECLDEFEQTEAYDFFSKLDAEASHEDKFIHSKIEECLFFLQYRFVKENRKGNFPFEDDGENLWNSLHNRREKSYTLREIIQQKEKDFYLTPTSVKEFSSLFEGRLSERSLVFHLPTNDGTLNVKSRYGWKKIHSKLEHFDSILITCEANTPILLPFFADKIIEKGKELHIQTEKTRVMYCGGRWNGKSSGGVGEVIGTTTGNELEISVERKNDNGEWQKVVPSLYYSSVDYQEEVELLASKETESSVVERAVQVYSRLKSQGFSTVGISAILGNFQIESGINPKRAEGDYLAPPVGAFKGCWDDDSWLEMGSAEIYGGKFPLIRHRGLGLGQWTDTTDGSNRALMLRTYAKERGEKWYNLDLQLDFILNGDSPIRSKIFKDVASISKLEQLEEATKTFLTFWEGNPLDKIELRISASRDWFFYFSQTEQSPTFNPLDAYLWAEKRIFPMPTKKEIETGWEGNGYAPGHCTWYVFNRMRQFGKHIHPFMGNAADWTENYKLTHGAKLAIQPIVGDAVIFEPGVQGSSTLYGHVAFVEHVFSEGNFLISEMNVNGIFTMRWRVVGIEKGVHFMRVVSGVE